MSALVRNYAPLPVVLSHGEGAWVHDTSGRRYLDLLAGYSALNFGHRHPALVAAAHTQLDRLTLTSRAFEHPLLEPFAEALTALTGTERFLPMNTGAEAVETAIKAVRRWGYLARGIPEGEATIIVADGNFHGRTTTITSFSTDPDAHDHFGPYTPGFRVVPYDDIEAVRAAIDETTVAVLIEPVQGEAGVVIPTSGYLPALRALCDVTGTMLVLDEVQSGLGRTGTTLAAQLSDVRADLTCLGKALGGGILPVSGVVGRADVLDLLTPGTHGSTFGGNPLACAVGLAVVGLLEPGDLQARAHDLGDHLRHAADGLVRDGLLDEVRSVGLWAGIDVPAAWGVPGRTVCERLAARGVLAKETHGRTLRLAPPLTIRVDDLDHGLGMLRDALESLRP
ncbi:ornithine--oxo-acid transaminase [Sanguibacter sp. A247]|uniref:ornithine--oxo-acid transaminase n=1 Tax=unclassified Sanguibacter TaxID=2645534 RepID=UPI003FD6DEC5